MEFDNKKQTGFIGSIYDQPETEKSMPIFAGIKKKNRNKFAENYREKNRTADILKHTKYEHIESMVKYLLLDEHPCRDKKINQDPHNLKIFVFPY